MPFNVAISAPKVFSQFVACELPQTPMSSNDADQTTALHQARLLTTHPKFLECELARDGDGSALDDGAYNQAQRIDWFDGNDVTKVKKRTVLRRKMRQQLKARNRQEAAEAQAPAQEQAQPSSDSATTRTSLQKDAEVKASVFYNQDQRVDWFD